MDPVSISLSHLTLLIVDDEPDLLETTSILCEDLACKVLTAQNGKDALEIILKNQVDTILSDINMPKMSGLELLTEIRSRGIDIPFIILSGYGDLNNVTKALRFGANDFLNKPFDEEQLLSILRWGLAMGAAIRKAHISIEEFQKETNLPEEKKRQLTEAAKAVQTIRELRILKKKDNL